MLTARTVGREEVFLVPSFHRARTVCLASGLLAVAALHVPALRADDQIATGVIISPKAFELAAETEGFVDTVLVDLGDTFEADDLLLRLEDRWQVHERNIALANLELAEADAASARSDLEYAANRARRRQQAPDSWSEEEREAASLEAQRAESSLAAALARLERAKAELRRSEDRYDRTQIRAPFPGAVTSRRVTAGQRVVAGQALFDLIAIEGYLVRFGVAENLLEHVLPGTVVEVSVSASAPPAKLVVQRIAPALDSTTRLAAAECFMSPETAARGGFVPGMIVEVRVRRE